MKEVIKYIADDGREFTSMEKCWAYEKDMQNILARVDEHKDNPG